MIFYFHFSALPLALHLLVLVCFKPSWSTPWKINQPISVYYFKSQVRLQNHAGNLNSAALKLIFIMITKQTQ